MQQPAGAEPGPRRHSGGRDTKPGGDALRWVEPARRGPHQRAAQQRADRVGHDIADARVAAGDPLLEKLDGEGQGHSGEHERAPAHAERGERYTERDKEQQVLDDFCHGFIA